MLYASRQRHPTHSSPRGQKVPPVLPGPCGGRSCPPVQSKQKVSAQPEMTGQWDFLCSFGNVKNDQENESRGKNLHCAEYINKWIQANTCTPVQCAEHFRYFQISINWNSNYDRSEIGESFGTIISSLTNGTRYRDLFSFSIVPIFCSFPLFFQVIKMIFQLTDFISHCLAREVGRHVNG